MFELFNYGKYNLESFIKMIEHNDPLPCPVAENLTEEIQKNPEFFFMTLSNDPRYNNFMGVFNKLIGNYSFEGIILSPLGLSAIKGNIDDDASIYHLEIILYDNQLKSLTERNDESLGNQRVFGFLKDKYTQPCRLMHGQTGLRFNEDIGNVLVLKYDHEKVKEILLQECLKTNKEVYKLSSS